VKPELRDRNPSGTMEADGVSGMAACPPDLEALVPKRLATGAFATAEDVGSAAPWKLRTLKRAGPVKSGALSMKKSTGLRSQWPRDRSADLRKHAGS
jgi:hypothetical protein